MPSLGIDIGALSQRLAVAEAGRAAPAPLPHVRSRAGAHRTREDDDDG